MSKRTIIVLSVSVLLLIVGIYAAITYRRGIGMTKPLTRWRVIGPYHWRIEWKRADQWIGRYNDTWWHDTHTGQVKRRCDDNTVPVRHVWICVLPTLPIHITRKAS
jgi:hypothetical protein